MTALLQVDGLPCRLIEELSLCERDQRVRGRFAGQVLKVSRDEKFTNFIVSDGSGTAEVNMVYRRIKCQDNLPKKGDSVSIVGHGYKKVLGGNKNEYSFVKILALSISSITLQQQFATNLNAAKTRHTRMKRLNPVQSVQFLKPLYIYKSFQSQADQQQLRSLIFIYCYYVFQHNSDIQSYIFNPEMIRCSKNGRQFMQTYGITKDCLDEVLKRTLLELSQIGIVSSKVMTQHNREEKFFLIKRDLFKGIEKTLEERIVEFGTKGGVNIQQLNSHTNKKLADFTNISYFLFNWKFLQKILSKLQGDNIIYKTADKLIFPNSRT